MNRPGVALARLAAAAAERGRLEGRHPDPRTTSHHEQRAYRSHCRAAGAAIRVAVACAHRDGVPVDAIARTVGFSAGYVRMILRREDHLTPNGPRTRLAPTGDRADEAAHVGPVGWTGRPVHAPHRRRRSEGRRDPDPGTGDGSAAGPATPSGPAGWPADG
ncbi:hypothetical protein [Embleya sp. MST-111070]|uniref:hypothetical protein n=1 Tax=Embleya sp. MST-111070 TaxID=3398231 RepID=UPI003F73BD49